MSRIAELIRDLCPDGVPVVRFGEVTTEGGTRNRGGVITAVQSVTNAGQLVPTEEFFAHTRTSSDTSGYKVVEPGAVAYNPARINVGSIALNREEHPVIVSPMYVVFSIDVERVDAEFLMQFVRSSRGRHYIGTRVQDGARFRLTYESIAGVPMPLPPLAVQREIIATLKKFELLEASLAAELAARRRQFGHYVESLLGFSNADDVQWHRLGDVGQFIRGRRFTKQDYVDDGGVPVIHYGEIYTHFGTTADSVRSHVRSDMADNLRFARPGDVILTDVGETVDDVGKAVAWLGSVDVAIHDHCYAFHHSMNPAFVSYYMQTNRFRVEKAKHVARTKVKTLLMDGLAKVRLPVPSPAEQERIVNILDKFNALVSDSSGGLGAEISARRRQHEHYRDKLLMFEAMA